MRRNIPYLLSFLFLLPAWGLWSCQSDDTPPQTTEEKEVEVEIHIPTRSGGPSDGYVHDLTVMAFWRDNESLPDIPDNYRFAYYSNVTPGEVVDADTGRRKVRFLIRKEEGRRQRFVFLANLYICNIYPYEFTAVDFSTDVTMQYALNRYTYFPYRRSGSLTSDSIPGWSALAGTESEPFPMCGETLGSYAFDDVQKNITYVLKNETGDEQVTLYRMAARMDIFLTDEVITALNGLDGMTLINRCGRGYVGYNQSVGYLNPGIVSDTDWNKMLKAWVPTPQVPETDHYTQHYKLTVTDQSVSYNGVDYTRQIQGPVYLNEAVCREGASGPDVSEFVFHGGNGIDYALRLDYDILRNCYYKLYINRVIKGSLSAILEVADWTQVDIGTPSPLPL